MDKEQQQLCLLDASYAKISDLFRYKNQNFQLETFPGYTTDQWGIKAHNRPWIEDVGQFGKGQKILEVGGAYSLLPKYLADKYDLEAWVGDDFGLKENEQIWSRWGDPFELPKKYPNVNYVFENFGTFSQQYPDLYFDRIFTVSTLEHIPFKNRLSVLKDMHRCLKPGGLQLHSIDIPIKSVRNILITSLGDKYPLIRKIYKKALSETTSWINLLQDSGVEVSIHIPNSLQLLDRQIVVESPDVVYRFVPPNNAPKPYVTAASLLLIIKRK